MLSCIYLSWEGVQLSTYFPCSILGTSQGTFKHNIVYDLFRKLVTPRYVPSIPIFYCHDLKEKKKAKFHWLPLCSQDNDLSSLIIPCKSISAMGSDQECVYIPSWVRWQSITTRGTFSGFNHFNPQGSLSNSVSPFSLLRQKDLFLYQRTPLCR